LAVGDATAGIGFPQIQIQIGGSWLTGGYQLDMPPGIKPNTKYIRQLGVQYCKGR
jgi:hypothetical protein